METGMQLNSACCSQRRNRIRSIDNRGLWGLHDCSSETVLWNWLAINSFA